MIYWDKADNPIVRKSKLFAIKVVDIYKYLTEDKHEYVMSRQLLRSGTSIGANIREAHRGHSDADYYAKMTIALKEADEPAYWLEILKETDYLNKDQFEPIYKDCDEIIRILVSITKHRNQDDPRQN